MKASGSEHRIGEKQEGFRFEGLADALPQIVWEARPDGYLDSFNAQYYEFSGNAPGAEGDSAWQPLVHPDDLAKNLETWSTALKTGEPFIFKQRLFDRTVGKHRWFLSRALPMKDPSGNILRWFGTCTDIDELVVTSEKLKAEKNRLAAIQKITALVAGELNLEALLQKLTATTIELFGAQYGAFFCSTPTIDEAYCGQKIVRLDDVTKDARLEKHLPHCGFPEAQMPIRSYMAVPVISRSGEVLGGFFYGHETIGAFSPESEDLARTISCQVSIGIENAQLFRQAEEAMKKKQESLEELARSNSELEQFAYVASHDLKEPLRMITTYLQLLNTRYSTALPDEAKEFIGFAVGGARRMHDLIGDLLAYAGVGKTAVYEKVSTEKVVRDVLLNLSARTQQEGVQIKLGELPLVYANPTELTQLFQNLIDNALKFRTKVAPVIEVGSRPLGKGVEFFVSDNGIGIPEQHLARIFVIFQRLHAKDQYPGTGIGLSICKKIVEKHGGKLTVESVPGQGTTFRFTLSKDI